MSFAQSKFKQLKMSEPPPKVIEGDDPFNDQVAAAEYLAPEPLENSKFVEEVRSLLAAKGIPEEEIFYKFGKALFDLSAMQCLEAKDYISKLRLSTSTGSRFRLHDVVVVVDPVSKYFRWKGLVISSQGDNVFVASLSRTVGETPPPKPVTFRPEQLKKAGEPDPEAIVSLVVAGSSCLWNGNRVKVLSVAGGKARVYDIEELQERTALVSELSSR